MSGSESPGAQSGTTMSKKRTVFGRIRDKLPKLKRAGHSKKSDASSSNQKHHHPPELPPTSDHSSRRTSSPSSPHDPASVPTVVPQVDPPPAGPPHSANQTPQDTVAGMIGNVTHRDTINSPANSGTGMQTNIRSADDSRGSVATSDSAENKISAVNPEKKGHNNPFTRLLHSQQTPSHPEPASVPARTPNLSQDPDTSRVFEILKDTANSFPDPLLSEAARLVLTIQQNIRDNTGAFSRLAEHACTLVSSVVLANGEKRLPPKLAESLKILLGELEPIKEFVVGQGNVKNHKMEAGQYTDKLTKALADFGSRSNISVQDGVGQINQKLEDLTKAFEKFVTSGHHEPADDAASSAQQHSAESYSGSPMRGQSSTDPKPPPTNQNYSSPNQEHPSSQFMHHRPPPTNYMSSYADPLSPWDRFQSTPILPFHTLSSPPGSVLNFVGRDQNTFYPGPTYHIRGNNIQGNTYSGVQGGVHYH